MSNRSVSSFQLGIDATDIWPRLHTQHGDGRWSLALTPDADTASIYVRGTYSELLDLAAKIVASVPATELPANAGRHATGLTVSLGAHSGDPRPVSASAMAIEVAAALRDPDFVAYADRRYGDIHKASPEYVHSLVREWHRELTESTS